ncbi:hypothetical protein PPYR_07597 [Photinus pyralis]|uniref:Inner centromere protein ARK-binding domain-containing protein n=1 Tax=Photinus pyralis TaxID=7054 RepID=A0A1Y1LVY1_PHOPY|nr:eukaryotic translation initiation factor 5B [Photinus pyralis]KAB0799717.1 hypothetical protein PPYR_07597 [Photinus pyralis]
MSVLDEITEVIENQIIPNVIKALRQFTIELEEGENANWNSIVKDIEKFKEQGVLTSFVQDISQTTNKNESVEKPLQEDISVPGAKRYTRRNRPQEDVLSDIANIVNDHNKQRNTRIKIERATNDLTTINTEIHTDEVVKQEIDMPPPTKPPLRNKRTGKNQSVVAIPEIKVEVLDNSVIEIPKAPLDVIVLDDSLDKPVRLTRARTKRKGANKEENEPLPENIRKTVQVERTSKRKQIASNDTGVITMSPQKKRIKEDNTDTDTTLMEVQNATLVKETVSSPMKKKGKGKAANVKKTIRSTSEHSTVNSSDGEAAALPQQVRMKKQITKKKTNSFKGDEEQSAFKRNSTEDEDSSPKKKRRARDKRANIKQSGNQGSTSGEDQQTTVNAETNSSEGETVGRENNTEDDNLAVGNSTVCIANPTVLKEKHALANETMVITKPTTVDDLMTDDEDFVPSSPPVHQGKGNQIFSPYESSPVKKRVQAFEKLETMNAEATSVTRSKAKLPVTPKARAQIEVFEKLAKNPDATVTRSKAKLEVKVPHMSTSTPKTKIPKMLGTPVTGIKYKTFQTLSAPKVSSTTINVNLAPSTAGKTGSALKASKMEFRERELHRQQKEQEALQKKEALLQSSIEEKRRKREEREMKVQQLKANKEKQRQRQLLSAEKTKEEKLKQVLAEKEAKALKQKEEAAQKRAAALKKVEDSKKNQVPRDDGVIPYLSPTPPLPTPDCYDSDDSARATIVIPQFQQKHILKQTLLEMRNLDAHQYDLFISGPETPNLKEIFPEIHASKLKRTSSGIWNKTERSILESMIEEDESE